MTPRTRGLLLLCGAVALSACGAGDEFDSNAIGGASSTGGGESSGGEGGTPSSGGESSSSGAAGEGAGSEQRSSIASYFVPVPEELTPWATYPVTRVVVRRDGDNLEIRYGFPRWLSGVRTRIVLTGALPEGTTTFDVSAGELGTGTCTRDGAYFECVEVLPGLEVDREKAREEMEGAGLAAEEIDKRLDVTDSFAVDPIGVLTFELELLEED
jgi:hypothetical protein